MAEYYLDMATMIGVLQSLGQTGQIEADLAAISLRGRESLPAGHLVIGVKAGRIYAWALLGANGQQILSGTEQNVNALLRYYGQQRIRWTFVQQTLEQSASLHAGPPDYQVSPSYQPSRPPYAAGNSSHGGSPAGSQGRAQVPYRKQNLAANMLATMPRQHRLIYALVNGVNTVERICELLPSLSHSDIVQILKELYSSNIISF
ncbi:hypothetical protein [Dictyobacter aurantiacus]|uniref:Uncharacterized protein n=1 Tax=Dictyobacter aurantiacus TaxID=1936993 RepID=A0A401ZJA6_9CHLR|nr:hypothetical protein [Dictyobacter aurantiacus]GCE06922.1 hypothetical protein KDAU_42510 [Dictyobacter aurantiacus]